MAHAVAAKGYADTTIADIVREASVSRRTFYEHFATKAECLIALYEAASHNALKVLRERDRPGPRLADAGRARRWAPTSAAWRSNPVLMRTLFIEILGLGAEGPGGAPPRQPGDRRLHAGRRQRSRRPAEADAAAGRAGDGGGGRHQRAGAAVHRGRTGSTAAARSWCGRRASWCGPSRRRHEKTGRRSAPFAEASLGGYCWSAAAGRDAPARGALRPSRGADSSPWNFTTSGTISSATMLMILISGLTAGPAVSL